MSKSIKLKNDNYWDSKGIVHNKTLLSNILKKIQVKSKEVSGNSGDYGNINLYLETEKYIILEMVVKSVSGLATGSPMAVRIGNNTMHYAHIFTDANTFTTVKNKDVTLTVYYIEK